MSEHRRGQTRTTRVRGPFVLVYVEVFDSKEEARKREKYLKSGKGREELRNILRDRGETPIEI